MALLSSAQHAALRRIDRVNRSIFEGIPPIGTDAYAGITGSLTAGSLARLLDVLFQQVFVSDEDDDGRWSNEGVLLDVYQDFNGTPRDKKHPTVGAFEAPVKR